MEFRSGSRVVVIRRQSFEFECEEIREVSEPWAPSLLRKQNCWDSEFATQGPKPITVLRAALEGSLDVVVYYEVSVHHEIKGLTPEDQIRNRHCGP